jgi:hypothetical protein
LPSEPAVKNNIRAPDSGFFSELRSVARTVVPEDFLDPVRLEELMEELRENFAADYARAAACSDLLFGHDVEGFGKKVTALFDRWEKEGGGPPLTAFMALAARHFEFDLSDPLVKAAFMGAALAEFPNDLAFHSNEHYRKVLFHAIRLVATHNDHFAGTDRTLDKTAIAKLLAAACVHDLGHMGGDNLKDGVYAAGYMEQRAFNIAKPYFEAMGADPEDLKDIETMIFCTDITFFAGDNSPCIRMKKIYRYYFWDCRKEDAPEMMMGKLRRFEDNPQLALMAMILHEADIATSAGLSYDQTIRETVSFMAERGGGTAGPRIVIAFLREQLGETLCTEAGRQIYGSVMADIIAHAEKDIEAGRDSF